MENKTNNLIKMKKLVFTPGTLKISVINKLMDLDSKNIEAYADYNGVILSNRDCKTVEDYEMVLQNAKNEMDNKKKNWPSYVTKTENKINNKEIDSNIAISIIEKLENTKKDNRQEIVRLIGSLASNTSLCTEQLNKVGKVLRKFGYKSCEEIKNNNSFLNIEEILKREETASTWFIAEAISNIEEENVLKPMLFRHSNILKQKFYTEDTKAKQKVNK